MTLLDYAIAPLVEAELPFIYDSWMRSSAKRDWPRVLIVDSARDLGNVSCARSQGLVLAWLCVDGGTVLHGFVRVSYRGFGLMRALWEAAGRPQGLSDRSPRKGRQLMRHLRGESEREKA